MALTRDAFQNSTKRILAVFSMTPEQGVAYLDSIYESVNWMDSYWFDMACKEIVRNFRAGARKPMPSEYTAAYHEARRKANANGQGKATRCRKARGRGDKPDDVRPLGCEEIGWVTAWYRHEDGRLIEAVKPCPDCRPGVFFTKPVLTEITREEYDAARGKKCFHTLVSEALSAAKRHKS